MDNEKKHYDCYQNYPETREHSPGPNMTQRQRLLPVRLPLLLVLHRSLQDEKDAPPPVTLTPPIGKV